MGVASKANGRFLKRMQRPRAPLRVIAKTSFSSLIAMKLQSHQRTANFDIRPRFGPKKRKAFTINCF
jgi:hypothetical protein